MSTRNAVCRFDTGVLCPSTVSGSIVVLPLAGVQLLEYRQCTPVPYMGAPEAGVKSSGIWDTAVAPGLLDCWSCPSTAVCGFHSKGTMLLNAPVCNGSRSKEASTKKRSHTLQRSLTFVIYSLFEPNSRTLAEYGVRLEKAILRDSELLSEVNNAFCNSHPLLAQKVVTRSARAAVSKISADALLAKAISVRRSQAGSLLKTIRKVNAKKLQESDILVGHRFHTAGAEPYFLDNSKSVEENRAAKRQRYQEDVEENRAAKRQRYQEDVEENRAAKRQRYQEDVEENRAAKRQKYEDNSAAIKASERNRYWNDPAVRLAKRAAERKRYRRGHRTTTTTQRCSAAPLPSAASSSSAAPTTTSSSSSAAHTASSRSRSSRSTATVLAPVPPPPLRLLPPWPLPPPTRMAPMA
ncbi:hypothetical protein EMCRGX_G008801 [Ephydatia muelleri]